MPSQSKKKPRAVVVLPPLPSEPQDYVDPLKKLVFNPGQTTAEKVVAGANKVQGRKVAPRPRARVSKLPKQLATQDPLKFDEAKRMDKAELQQFYAEDEIKRESARFEELTTVPDVTLSATGGITPGTGVVLSSILRSGYKGMNSSLGVIGQLFEDVGMLSPGAAGEDTLAFGQTIKDLTLDLDPTFQAYDQANPVQQRGVAERTAGFLTELGIQLPQMAVAAELLGPAAGFGFTKVMGLRAAGEQDPGTLAGAYIQGAAEGALLNALGKTAAIVERSKGGNAVTKLLKKSPVGAQAIAQGLGGVAQTGVDGLLHPDHPTPDWLDYLHGGAANVIMDPVVLGGSGRSRKATQAATKVARETDPSSYNLGLPPDNLQSLRQDFWQPKDLPWDNRVTVGLLNKARVQFADNPADPDGALYLNPQAALVIDRASQAVMPGSKVMTGMAQGMVVPAKDVGLVADHLLEKAAQFKETIRQLPDGDPQLNDLATGAVVFESLAEHLQAAVGDKPALAMRLLQKEKAADPSNPIAKGFDQTILGHESTHAQVQKIATELKIDPRAATAPGWLADHPIGAKVILGIGDAKSPLQSYDPTDWTAEAIAYAAQPGPDPGLGLTKQERGVLVGDYLAELMDKHGPGVMEQYWAGRMDREVAVVAFKRLYEANRVKYTRDPISGRRLGLEWRGVDPPRIMERVPDNGWGMERQPVNELYNYYTATQANEIFPEAAEVGQPFTEGISGFALHRKLTEVLGSEAKATAYLSKTTGNVSDNGYGMQRQPSVQSDPIHYADTILYRGSTEDALDPDLGHSPGIWLTANKAGAEQFGSVQAYKLSKDAKIGSLMDLAYARKTVATTTELEAGTPEFNKAVRELLTAKGIDVINDEGFRGAGGKGKEAFNVINPSVLELVTDDRLYSVQPDPDYDAASPANSTTDDLAAQIDPEVTQSNAPPDVAKAVFDQRAAELKAYREISNARARIKKNSDLKQYTEELEAKTGISNPEFIAEIEQYGAELKQQHVEATKRFRKLRTKGNQLKAQLARQLSDDTARKRAEARLAAKGRLANGDQLPPLDAPVDQVILSDEYHKFLANLAKDALLASDLPILSSSELSTTDQLLRAMTTGQIQPEVLDSVAKRFGLKNHMEVFERFRQMSEVWGRTGQTLSTVQKYLDKLRGYSPELDKWIAQRPPTMQEIDAIAAGPGILRRLVNLNIGAQIATLMTQTPNVITGAVNAVPVRTVINTVDQVLETIARTQRNTAAEGEPVKYEQNSVPPLSKVLSPVFAASTVTKELFRNPYWFAHGKLKPGQDQGAAGKAIRIAQDLHAAQADLMKKFDSQLNDEAIQLHLLPSADSIKAQREALTLLKHQVANMPAGADKTSRLNRIIEAEKRLKKSEGVLPRTLHEIERGLHKYLTLARMGERFVRTITLVASLDREATRVGLDLSELDRNREVHKLPQDVVARAVNDALVDTYALRPDPASTAGKLYNDYARSDHPGWVLTSAVFPFVGFMGNYAKMFIDYSPLPLIKAGLVGAGVDRPSVDSHQQLVKAMLGTAVYITTAALVKDKYDEAERTGKPVSSWHDVGGVSVRNVPQMVVPLYLADYMERQRRGLKAPEADTALEFFNILSGLDARNLTGTFKWLDDLINSAQDESGNKLVKTGESAAAAFSGWFARYLTPLDMYTTFAAQWSKDLRDVKDLYGLGAGSLYAPILNKVPVARESLPDKIDPYTGMPVSRTDYPAVKALTGFTVLPPQTHAAQVFNHAGIKLVDWIPFTGIPEFDRDMVGEIGRRMQEELGELAQDQQGLSLDEQIVDTYKVARVLAQRVFNETLTRYPDIQQKIQDSKVMNHWERRVDEKERKLVGEPSRQDEYKELKKERELP